MPRTLCSSLGMSYQKVIIGHYPYTYTKGGCRCLHLLSSFLKSCLTHCGDTDSDNLVAAGVAQATGRHARCVTRSWLFCYQARLMAMGSPMLTATPSAGGSTGAKSCVARSLMLSRTAQNSRAWPQATARRWMTLVLSRGASFDSPLRVSQRIFAPSNFLAANCQRVTKSGGILMP